MELQPITMREATAFIERHHRHHKPMRGGKFAIAINDAGIVIGVAVVGRPVARMADNGWTAEVTRLCVIEDHKNACSMLYAACWRAARAMGYRKLITYILESERGISLKAAGWKVVGKVEGRSWSCPSRPRVDMHPLQDKLRFEAV